MTDDDSQSPGTDATAQGILHCLRMLAEEAQSLCLTRTLAALRIAMDVCQGESAALQAGLARTFPRPMPDFDEGGAPLGQVLH